LRTCTAKNWDTRIASLSSLKRPEDRSYFYASSAFTRDTGQRCQMSIWLRTTSRR